MAHPEVNIRAVRFTLVLVIGRRRWSGTNNVMANSRMRAEACAAVVERAKAASLYSGNY